MFRRAFYASILLLTVTLAAIYVFLIRLRPKDTPNYRQLVQASVELRSRKALEREPARQLRQSVQKDIWIANGEERHHFLLKSAESHLFLTQKKEKIEAIEELKHIECFSQEAIHPKTLTQQVRTLQAEEGIYYFPSHRFSAETVRLAFYQIPGIELPFSLEEHKPFLRGTAQTTTFSAVNKNPTFQAHFLKLYLDR